MSDTPVYDQMLHELSTYPDLVGAQKGDTFTWLDNITITVTRVASDNSWVDVRCHDTAGREWTKRQPLPESTWVRPPAAKDVEGDA